MVRLGRSVGRRLSTLALMGALPLGVVAPPLQDAQLARAFAPVFVFHPQEEFFPCSPLADFSTGADGPDLQGLAGLQSIARRIEEYSALPLSAKLSKATVFYRVRPGDQSGRVIHIEYWLYYVNNTYELYGGLFPYHVSDVHPHDLEHVYLRLEKRPGAPGSSADDYLLRAIETSAHAGGVRNNRFVASDGTEIERPVHALVERGSHAMAPDIDGDSRFTPGVDASGDRKSVWGIRDDGATWARYDPRHTDPRPLVAAVRLAAAGASGQLALSAGISATYGLVAVEDIEARFGASPTDQELRAALFGRTSWIRQLFGNVRTDTLVRPGERSDVGTPSGIDRVALTDRGLMAGFTNILSPFTTLVGARYAVATRAGYIPDALVDGAMLLTAHGSYLFEVNAFATYPIDAITNLVVGESLRAHTVHLTDPQANWQAGIEVRLSQWRIRTVARDPHKTVWLDVRLFYLF